MLHVKSKSSQNSAESASNQKVAKSVGLADNRAQSIIQQKQAKALIAKSHSSYPFNSQQATVQLMSAENANKSIDNEELVWYTSRGSSQKVRIAKKVGDQDKDAEVYLMDGTELTVKLSALQVKKKGESLDTQIAPKGVALSGPSKPIQGEKTINRGEVDTELIGGVPHVRVYTAVMGSIDFLTENPETGVATSSTVNKMARPFSETKPWSKVDIDNLLQSNPKLVPVYARYEASIGQVKTIEANIELLNKEQEELIAFVNAKNVEWPLRSRTPSQKAEVKSKERRKYKINQRVKSYKLEIGEEQKKIDSTRKDLGFDLKIVPKDIHQHKDGKITISTGGNSILWAGMGTPLRALKWSEKYFAQILNEKPSLKPTYEKYKKAVSEIELLDDEVQRLQKNIAGPTASIQSKNKAWSGQKRTKNQQKSLKAEANKIDKIEKRIEEAKTEIKQQQAIINATRVLLSKDANPLIRSFLIPFASYEKISKRAIPEELSKVAADAEDAIAKWDKVKDKPRLDLEATEVEIKRYSELKMEQQIKEMKCNREVERIDKLKPPNKKLIKRRSLNKSQAKAAAQSKLKYGALLKPLLAKKVLLETQLSEMEKPILVLAKRAMSDVNLSSPIAKVIEEIKKRDFITGSINVDRHDEANQFGVKGVDIDILRQDAVPGSLITYARYPEEMSRERGSESGKIQSTTVLRDKLGVPKKELSSSPWLSGEHFADTSKLEANADKLAMYYSTWLKSKDPKFNEESLLAKNLIKIPITVREKMLAAFLKENGVPPQKKDEFMEKVLSPWASQNMIAHILASDYDRMNKDQNMTAKGEGQDFAKMRYDLPLRRNKMRKTGGKLDIQIAADVTPKHLLDILIADFPELKQRYEKISAKSEAFTFYDHAQMVYNQFMKLSPVEADGNRLISKALIGKMILFHDMEKWNSKEQYGAEGEHKLTIDEMKNYKELWGNMQEAKIAQALVNSDPFGEYMKGKIDKVEAHQQIIDIAQKLGFGKSKFNHFFKEYHQFFQSDFSSYTDMAHYTPIGGEKQKGKPVFNKYFEMTGPEQSIKLKEGRFLYSEAYEKKFTELEELFKKSP
jgi:hypothetical protein